MSTAPIGAASVAATSPDRTERLRRTARDLEGVFVEQLFKAMRETVPEGGLVEGGSGEEMFTALLDQKLSAVAPHRWQTGLSEALVRQLGGQPHGEGEQATSDPRAAHLAAGTAPSSPVSSPPILHPNVLSDASTPEPS